MFFIAPSNSKHASHVYCAGNLCPLDTVSHNSPSGWYQSHAPELQTCKRVSRGHLHSQYCMTNSNGRRFNFISNRKVKKAARRMSNRCEIVMSWSVLILRPIRLGWGRIGRFCLSDSKLSIAINRRRYMQRISLLLVVIYLTLAKASVVLCLLLYIPRALITSPSDLASWRNTSMLEIRRDKTDS